MEKKKELLEVVFILDRSGSMMGLEKDTIGGFNSMLEKQKEEADNIVWSTVLFDHMTEVVHDRVPVDKVQPLTEDTYFVRGSTALLDAVGGAIRHIGNVHKYAREEDVPARTLVIITTDGMENASRYYTYREVKRLIENQQEKYGWEFLFLGANIDAAEAAESIGIAAEQSVRYHSDDIGTKLNYEVMGDIVHARARGSKAKASSYLKKIDRDYKARK